MSIAEIYEMYMEDDLESMMVEIEKYGKEFWQDMETFLNDEFLMSGIHAAYKMMKG
jgi:hypothetical protein